MKQSDNKQTELSPPPAEEKEEDTDDGITLDPLFEKWLDESIHRLKQITEYQQENGIWSTESTQIIRDKAIRPFFYFKKDMQEDTITPKQFKTIVQIIEDKNDKATFIKWAAEHDDIDLTKGTPIETIAQLTKEQASDFIGKIYG